MKTLTNAFVKLKNMLLNKNKNYAQKLRPYEITPKILNKPKKLSNEVIKMIRGLKNDDEIDENLYENDIEIKKGVTKKDEIIIRFRNYLNENREDEKLPNTKVIINELGITDKVRRRLMTILAEKQIIKKKNDTTYIWNEKEVI
jgi:hypothetical protein